MLVRCSYNKLDKTFQIISPQFHVYTSKSMAITLQEHQWILTKAEL